MNVTSRPMHIGSAQTVEGMNAQTKAIIEPQQKSLFDSTKALLRHLSQLQQPAIVVNSREHRSLSLYIRLFHNIFLFSFFILPFFNYF